MRQHFLLTFFLLVLVLGSSAQNSKKYFNDFLADDSASFGLSIYGSAFFDNKEFTGDIKKGYTLPGYFIQPRFVYKPTSKSSISGGIHTLYYAGADSTEKLVPVFTLQYSMTDNIDFIIGTIDSRQSHFLPEPLFKPERFFISQPETGVQFLAKTDRLKGDLWVNWERFIKEKSPFQEVFTVGFSGIYSINPFEKSSGFYFPIHALAVHNGGQIDSSNLPVTTLANLGGGVGYGYYFEGKGLTLGVECQYLISKDASPQPHYVYKSGSAISPKIFVKSPSINIEVGYWSASKFVNPRGEELFGSVSMVDSSLNQNSRDIITSKLVYHKQIVKGFTAEFRFDLYYDCKASLSDYSYTFRMVFDEQFLLRRKR